jgi:tRNA threonylcarbamoyladenosine biosynthesis protein TsaB
MILTIDTATNSPLVSLGKTKIALSPGKNSQKDGLLAAILLLIKKNGLELTDIEEIKINPGPGSFTGLRVGFSVANTLGWYLGIPVNGKMVADSQISLPKYD